MAEKFKGKVEGMWKEMFLTRVPEYEEGAEENHANSLSK
jgi:hypothetical protein